MTTFIARHGDRTANTSAPFRAGVQRFTHSLVSLTVILRAAVDATRALNDAHTVADRRAVASRFAAESGRSSDRSAA